jgi:hypothetical protein
MKSRLAEAARERLCAHVQRMTPEQRLAAYLDHCQLMAQLRQGGGSSHRRKASFSPRNAN